MTQQDKELLLKDLCGRLPYGVKILTYASDDFYDPLSIETLSEIDRDGYISTVESDTLRPIGKPYLLPISSMTEEQKKELIELINTGQNDNNEFMRSLCSIEFYHKNHIDYRGLIKKGLANDATGLNIY